MFEDKLEGNQGFENSVRCLQHPLSLMSIALLLLNDHVFKTIYPSWLTGKLSDFAGLFFFPFIVTAILSILLVRLKLKLQTIGSIAFGLVAIWFFLFKTIPSTNEASVSLISTLLGKPVNLLLDATDAWALVMLIPSWKSWRQTQGRKTRKLSYAPLLLGVFASLATSPMPPQVQVVTHLIEGDSDLIAIDSTNWTTAVSEDGGKTWNWTDRNDVDLFPIEPVPLPKSICSKEQKNNCYRVNGQGIVEFSNDSGNSWITAWKLPDERLSFIKRIDPDLNLGPYDLLEIQWDGVAYLLVAMGEEGVLRKELPDGEWERLKVQDATPTPYAATSISNAFSVVWFELLILFLVSIFAFIVACQVIWSSNSQVSTEPLSKIQWVLLPALSPILGILITLIVQAVLGAIFYGIVLMALYNSYNNDELTILSVFAACLVIALLALPITIYLLLRKWRRLIVAQNYSLQTASRLVQLSYLTHISVFLIGTTNWLLWSTGIIPLYWITWITTILSNGLIAEMLLRKIGNLSRQHISKDDTT